MGPQSTNGTPENPAHKAIAEIVGSYTFDNLPDDTIRLLTSIFNAGWNGSVCRAITAESLAHELGLQLDKHRDEAKKLRDRITGLCQGIAHWKERAGKLEAILNANGVVVNPDFLKGKKRSRSSSVIAGDISIAGGANAGKTLKSWNQWTMDINKVQFLKEVQSVADKVERAEFNFYANLGEGLVKIGCANQVNFPTEAPAPKFKAGDLVECIDDKRHEYSDTQLEKGKRYGIRHVACGDLIALEGIANVRWTADRFKLVQSTSERSQILSNDKPADNPAPGFKVGDKVQVVDDSNDGFNKGGGLKKGDIHVITGFGKRSPGNIEVASFPGVYWLSCRFELVKQPTTVIEWLETIEDKEIRDSAVAYCRAYGQNVRRPSESLQNALDFAFVWNRTKQGAKFWHDFQKSLK